MLYDFKLIEYLGVKLGVYPTIIIAFAPTIIIIIPVIFFFKKQINQKQYANWLGVCLAVIAVWVVLFFGFRWWIGLIAAIIAFFWGKFQSEAFINLANYFNQGKQKDS